MKRVIVLIFILLLAISVQAIVIRQNPKICVLDIAAEDPELAGIAGDMSETFSAVFATNYPGSVVKPKGHGGMPPMESCQSVTCAAAAGKTAKADYTLYTVIFKNAGRYTIESTMVTVSNETIVYKKVKQVIQGELESEIIAIAAYMASMLKKMIPIIEPEPPILVIAIPPHRYESHTAGELQIMMDNIMQSNWLGPVEHITIESNTAYKEIKSFKRFNTAIETGRRFGARYVILWILSGKNTINAIRYKVIDVENEDVESKGRYINKEDLPLPELIHNTAGITADTIPVVYKPDTH